MVVYSQHQHCQSLYLWLPTHIGLHLGYQCIELNLVHQKYVNLRFQIMNVVSFTKIHDLKSEIFHHLKSEIFHNSDTKFGI